MWPSRTSMLLLSCCFLLPILGAEANQSGRGGAALHHHEEREHVLQPAVDLNGVEPALHPHGREVHTSSIQLAVHPNGVEPALDQHQRQEHVRHETSMLDSDPDSQIHKFSKGGRARFNFICSPLSASGFLHATRSEPEVAAASKPNLHVATAPSELNSGNLFDRTVQIQSGIAGRLTALTMIMIVRFVTVVDRASERKRGGGRGRASSATVLAILLLVAAALLAKPAMAARPLSGGGHDEVAAAAAPGKPALNDAAAGHSSCTTDPNTQQPVRCIIHH